MDKNQFTNLVDKVNQGTASDDELEAYNTYLNQAINGNGRTNYIHPEEEEELKAELMGRIATDIVLQPQKQPQRKIVTWPRIAAAASIIVALSVGGYFMIPNKKTSGPPVSKTKTNDVAPGQNQATLTLANGQKIILNKGLTGKLAQQGNTSIHVSSNSAITYSPNSSQANSATEVAYNTLTTKVGEQSPYPLILADGTKVWLNAASSLTFPTEFNGKKRQVHVTGEAYFEVAHNAAQPFTVKTGNQIVEDIGTAFNINSYVDEPAIKTTLVEGSAKVLANGIFKILRPGHQTLVNSNLMLLQPVDSEAETAWMAGKFVFHDEELHSVMRQLSRWYKINVVYDYDPSGVLLGGGFSKSRNISKVLAALEQTGAVKFKIQGNTVRVTK